MILQSATLLFSALALALQTDGMPQLFSAPQTGIVDARVIIDNSLARALEREGFFRTDTKRGA